MQDDIKDCGVASLMTIIKTYGGNVSLEYLKMLTNTTKKGTNAYYLLEAGKTIGFDVRAVKGNVKDLNCKNLPCIAHVIIDSKYKHFVVIHKITPKYILIADPAYGIKKMSYEEFDTISTNCFLLYIPNKKIPNYKDEKELVIFIFKNLLTNKTIIISIFVFSLIYTLINIFTSYSFQFIIEDAITLSSVNNLYFIIIFLFTFTVLKNLSDYIRIDLLNYINIKLDFVLTSNTFKHMISLPYQYYKTKSTGDVLSRITDLSSIKDSISRVFMSIFVDSILIIFVFIFLIKINVTLTLVSILIIIGYFIIIKIFNPLLNKKIIENQEQVSKVNLSLIESLESVETIKGLSLENNFTNKFSDVYQKYVNTNYKFSKVFNLECLFKDLIDGIGLNFIMFLGAFIVLKDKMTVGELITYNTLIVYFLEPLKNIIDSDIYLKRAKVALKRINELYSIKEEKLQLDNKYTSLKVDGNITFNNVSYSYNGRDNILKDVCFEVKQGTKVLLYGESGSGKSTLVKLIMKFFDIENNKILINEKDINEYNLLEIRRDICYVSQNEKLFTDTVYNNITLDRDISYVEFSNVCKMLDVEKIVEKNINKYDMLLEEDGFNISGGERQKIIMARALLKQKNIYIFDESLSQVDIKSERSILKNIFENLKDNTVIVISHRFDNSDLFDESYKIEEGKIEYGLTRI